MFLFLLKRKFEDIYVTGGTLGSGTFAKVKLCIRLADKKQFAVKIIEKKLLTRRETAGLKDEIRILKAMKYPHILSITDSFDNGRQIRLVLELCEADDLYDRISKSRNGYFSETRAAFITCILARTVKYLHENFVVHRDLKPENILFTKKGVLKVSDYGLAHYLKIPKDLHFMHTCCGTPHYVAPEVLNTNEYTYKVDYWSIGVILYIMLCGFQPFNSHTINGMYALIIKGEYNFPSPYWTNISQDAKHCVSSLMCVDVKQRLDADQLMRHSFIIKNVNLRQLRSREKCLMEEQKIKYAEMMKERKNKSVSTCNNNLNITSKFSKMKIYENVGSDEIGGEFGDEDGLSANTNVCINISENRNTKLNNNNNNNKKTNKKNNSNSVSDDDQKY